MKIRKLKIIIIIAFSFFCLKSFTNPIQAGYVETAACAVSPFIEIPYCWLPDPGSDISDCFSNNPDDGTWTSECCVQECLNSGGDSLCIGNCPGYTGGEVCNTASQASLNSSNCGECATGYKQCCTPSYSPWTKYSMLCKLQKNPSYPWGSGCEEIWTAGPSVCSLGDKYNAPEPSLMKAGACDCSVGGTYKACCGASGLVSATPYQADLAGTPLEAYCPAGSSVIWQEGSAITLAWAQATCSPCPPAVTCTAANACKTVDNGTCGTKVCPAINVTCDSSNYGLTVTNGTCIGSTPGTKVCPCAPAQSCPITCHTNTVTVPNGSCGTTSCPPNAPAAETCPTCRSSTTTVPDGSCGTITCAQNCFSPNICVGGFCVPPNDPPVFTSLVLKNNISTIVPSESGNRNQICQTSFNGSRTINVTITGSDPDGASDIANIQLRWNGISLTRTSLVNGVANFNYSFLGSQNNVNLYSFEVYISDSVGNTTGWINAGRSFKVWNCLVPISGNIYDGTDGIVCPGTGFSIIPDKDSLNFKSLAFNQGGTPFVMTVNPDGLSYGPNNLTCGLNGYIPSLNSDIALSSQQMKSQSSTAASPTCGWYIDTTNVDPYVASPSFDADFSGVINQDPWWQASGGVISNNKVIDRLPVTCSSNCQISTSGLVTAPTVNNTGRSINNAQSWYYSDGLSAKLANVNTNYSYFFNQYFVKNGVGVTLLGDKSIADISGTGIYFVDGNLTIDNNKTINPGDFLMVIVKGNINVSSTVSQIDGILVAYDINATGDSNNQLVFNGSLFAFNDVNFSRGYSTQVTNNNSPAVVVKHNPQLLFTLPGTVAKVLTNWQWGN